MTALNQSGQGCPDYAAMTAAIATVELNGLLVFSPLERQILSAFDGWEIVPAHELSRRTNYPNTPHFRSILSNLVERRALQSTSRGYHLVT